MMKTHGVQQIARIGGVVASSVLVLVIAVMISATDSQAARQPVPTTGPFVATFSLDHEVAFFPSGVFPEGVSGAVTRDDGTYVQSTDAFLWEFTNLSNWTWSRLCCADPVDGSDSRDQTRVRPDGTKWFRSSPAQNWELSGSFDPQEGMVPLPDLAPRTSVETGPDSEIDVGETSMRTGIAETDVRSVRFGDAGGTEILRVYSKALGLTIDYYETASDGYVVRHLSLVDLSGQ